MSDFNKKFSTTAAPALAQMHPMHVKDLYLQSLSHYNTKGVIAMMLHLPLQQLMQKALDYNFAMEPEARSQKPTFNTTPNPNSATNRTPAGTGTYQNQPQNPNRRYCGKCIQWFDVSKGFTCRAKCNPAIHHSAGPNKTTSQQNQQNRPRPRASLAEMDVQEGEAYPEDNQEYTEDTQEYHGDDGYVG